MAGEIHSTVMLCDLTVTVHSISLAKVPAGAVRKYYQHRHPGFEIHYVTNGRFRIQCDEGIWPVESGMMLMIPPGTYHNTLDTQTDGERISICFGIVKPPGTKPGSKADRFDRCFDKNTPVLMDLKNSECVPVLRKMEALLSGADEDPYRKDKMLALCCGLLLELAGQITNAKAKQSVCPAREAEPDADFVIDRFLGRNFMSNNAMERMAEELHVSTRQLRRIIKKCFGANYRQKLSETRIKIAVDMLCNTDMPIYAIAEELGYSSAANFSAFIKRCTQKTPSQIRKDRMPRL